MNGKPDIDIKAEVYAICEKAGFDPKDVVDICIKPGGLTVAVAASPKTANRYGELDVISYHYDWTM